jgi:hypothetical protein
MLAAIDGAKMVGVDARLGLAGVVQVVPIGDRPNDQRIHDTVRFSHRASVPNVPVPIAVTERDPLPTSVGPSFNLRLDTPWE